MVPLTAPTCLELRTSAPMLTAPSVPVTNRGEAQFKPSCLSWAEAKAGPSVSLLWVLLVSSIIMVINPIYAAVCCSRPQVTLNRRGT